MPIQAVGKAVYAFKGVKYTVGAMDHVVVYGHGHKHRIGYDTFPETGIHGQVIIMPRAFEFSRSGGQVI
jgi:hypothetical protein